MNQPVRISWTAFSRPQKDEILAAVAAAGAAAGVTTLLGFLPSLRLELLARGAATLAGALCGAPVVRVDLGWWLAGTNPAVVVSAACCASGFFTMVAALFGWQLVRHRWRVAPAIGVAMIAAVPIAIGVNALRVVIVAQVHRWIIPMLPDRHGAFLHMLTGVAVFLPALIVLNLVVEHHGYIRCYRRSVADS